MCLVSKAFAWGPRAHKQNVYRKFGLDPATEYPPCEGVWGVSEVRAPLQDEIVDRFQIQSDLGGSYASPLAISETAYTLESRALMENYQKISESGGNYYYFKFKIKSTQEPLLLEYGEAIPWFDKYGGAIQIKTSIPFHRLSEDLEVLEKWKYSNSAWSKLC
ncbi:hypothetical protein CNR22_12040 [Sphingobacteriaceae bacterium]|nr:hypothetical protein CNR22_12040 [Sphingobacteriaceae bacterium]